MYRYVYFSFWHWWFLAFPVFIGDKNQGKMSHSKYRLKPNKIPISLSCNNIKMSGLVHIILIFSLECTLLWVSAPKTVGYKKCVKLKVKPLSRVRLFATPWTAAYQTPPSMGFSRQEYWSGVPFPSIKRPENCLYPLLLQLINAFNFMLCKEWR